MTLDCDICRWPPFRGGNADLSDDRKEAEERRLATDVEGGEDDQDRHEGNTEDTHSGVVPFLVNQGFEDARPGEGQRHNEDRRKRDAYEVHFFSDGSGDPFLEPFRHLRFAGDAGHFEGSES